MSCFKNKTKNIFMFLSIFFFLLIIPNQSVYAIVGVNAIDDCGIRNVGELPSSSECAFPNVSTGIQNLSMDEGIFSPGADEGFIAFCTNTLIHKDDNKAVFLTAAHCPLGFEDFPTYVTHEPQPVIPWSSYDFGFLSMSHLRPYSYDQNLIEVEKILIHPMFLTNIFFNPGNLGDVSVDLGLYLVDVHTLSQNEREYLDSIEPIKVAPLDYLRSFSQRQLREATFTAVGYNRIVPPMYNTNPDVVVEDSRRSVRGLLNFVQARGNRTYGELEFNNIKPFLLTTNPRVQHEESNICNGDSGGPLIMNDPNTGEPTIVGINVLGGGDYCANGWVGSVRLDISRNAPFIACAIDENLSIDDVETCINEAYQ